MHLFGALESVRPRMTVIIFNDIIVSFFFSALCRPLLHLTYCSFTIYCRALCLVFQLREGLQSADKTRIFFPLFSAPVKMKKNKLCFFITSVQRNIRPNLDLRFN